MKKQSLQNLASVVVFTLGFVLLFLWLTDAFLPKRTEFPWDVSRKVRGYYSEPEDTLDFVFIGSSQMFCAIAPAVLWHEQGITSYDFGAVHQSLPLSYYYIQEALKTQTPLAVVLDVRYCVLEEPTIDEGMTHINTDEFKYSLNRLRMIRDTTAPGTRWPFLLPLMLYHNNWDNTPLESLHGFGRVENPYKGYTPVFSDNAVPAPPSAEMLATVGDRAPLPEASRYWLQKIIDLSKEKGFELLLIKVPDALLPDQALYNTVGDIAAAQGIPFINFNPLFGGSEHLAVARANTFSSLLGEYLAANYPVTDKRGDPAYAAWDDCYDLYLYAINHNPALE